MFYQEDKVNNALKCSKCRQRLDEPKMLPCGEIVCSTCVSSIQVNNSMFRCLICDKMHMMPDDGLPVNKNLSTLISMQPSDVYRGMPAETLKELLLNMPKQILSLKFSINNGTDKIKEFCNGLKSEVHLTTEEAIQQLHEHRSKFFDEIDEFQKITIATYQPNKKQKAEFNDTVKELESFHAEWNQYLKNVKVNDLGIMSAIKQANKLREKADQTQNNLNDFIFNGSYLKFYKNLNKLDKTVLGSLEMESFVKIVQPINLKQSPPGNSNQPIPINSNQPVPVNNNQALNIPNQPLPVNVIQLPVLPVSRNKWYPRNMNQRF
jgi:hypothetical protein